MKLAFVSGPFRAPDAWSREQNIRRAEEVALALWRMGFAVICPHTNTRFFEGALPDAVWLAGDLEMLRRCDLLVTVPGWEASVGACSEVAAFDLARVYHWPRDRGLIALWALRTEGPPLLRRGIGPPSR